MLEPFELNLRHLDAIVAIAQLGRINTAAAAINMTQPALTQAVAVLERTVGTRLFDRLPNGMYPTVAGDMLIRRCERALAHLASACRADEGPARGTLLAHPGRRLSMRQLRTFLAVRRQGDYQLAAEELGVGRTAIIHTTRQLGLVFGEDLLRLNGKSVTTTEAGERLAIGAGLALAELRAGLEDLESHQQGDSASMAIGTLPLPGAELLPEVISRFATTRSRLHVEIIGGSYLELMTKLRGGELDILLGSLRMTPETEDLSQLTLFEEELFVVGASHHPLVDQPMDAAMLARFPWVVAPPGSPVRNVWDALFAGVDLPGKVLRCGSASTVRGLLLADHWLALLSPAQFRVESAAGLLRPVFGPLPGSRRQLGLITRKDWEPTRSQQDFVALLVRVAADLHHDLAPPPDLQAVRG